VFDPRALLNQIKLLRKTEVTIDEAETIAPFFRRRIMLFSAACSPLKVGCVSAPRCMI
jgi:hypothetical protein